MEKNKRKQSFLGRITGITSLARRGFSGWMVIIGLVIVLSLVVMTLLAPWIAPYDPSKINVGPRLIAPNPQYPLGTTSSGQDMLSRIEYGGGIMLQVSILSVAVCLAIGMPLGLFSSYIGGKVDRVLSLFMDTLYAFPGLVLAIAIAAVLGRGVVNMALAIAVVYIPSYFRVIRSQVLTIKEIPYTEAARSIGAKSRTILFSYIMPNVVPSIITVATINFADAILTAAGLTFVGLGLEINVPDWGRDLTDGRALLASGSWWVIVFPGIMIVLLAMGFTLVGEGLGELFNPKLQLRGG